MSLRIGHSGVRGAERHVNNERPLRLWREEGLKVPLPRKKLPTDGAMGPIAPNIIWAKDFHFNETSSLHILKTGKRLEYKSRTVIPTPVSKVNPYINFNDNARQRKIRPCRFARHFSVDPRLINMA